MGILLILGYFIMFFISCFFLKSKINRIPLIIYISWWGLLIIISLTNPYGLYPVSGITYLLLFLNTFMFFMGYIIVSYKKKNYNITFDINLNKLNKLILPIQIVVLPILVFYVIKYQLLLKSLGHSYARLIKYDLGLLFTSVYESAFYSYILAPILTITSILAAIKFIQRDIKNITFILMFINIILNTQIGLGRFGYFELMMYMLMVYFIMKNSDKSVKSLVSFNKGKFGQRILLFFISFMLITIMNYTLLIRKGYQEINSMNILDGYNLLFDQAFAYFVGPFRALDYLLTSDMFSEHSYFYGRLTLGGVDHILGMFFKLVASNYEVAYQTIVPVTQNPIIIGQDKTFNAFYTSLMNHYLDFNIIGVLIFPFLNGMIVAYFCNKFVKKQSIAILSLLIFSLYNAIISSLKWNYQHVSTWIVLILLAIFYFNEYRMTSNNKKSV